VLWLFTDAARGRDPLAAAAGLPRGLAGVVFRHDGVAGRAELGRALALVCRARRLTLTVAGDARLAVALGAGVHLRGGAWPGLAGRGLLARRARTSSAHTIKEARRARRAGAVVFVSPAFATASHPGASGLGPIRWARLTRAAQTAAGAGACALGGIDGRSVRRLPGRLLAGAGAIGALGG